MVPYPKDFQCRRASTITTLTLEAASRRVYAGPAACVKAGNTAALTGDDGVSEEILDCLANPYPVIRGIGQNSSWSNALNPTRSPSTD